MPDDASRPADPGAPEQGQLASARRLGAMLHHSMHLFVGVLWLVGLERGRRDGLGAGELVLALVLAAVYLAGIWWRWREQGRASTLAGRWWVGLLVAVWAALCACSSGWVWLAFPILFLVLFIWPRPWSWLGVGLAALWAGLSPLARGEPLAAAGVLGPLFGAAFAVVAVAVFGQLRSDLATQRRLTAEVAELAAARARAEEREALARDLHDTLAQGLNSIVMLSRAAAAQHPQAADSLALVESTARDNLAQARLLVRAMAEASPAGDDRGGDPSGQLGDGLAALVEQTARQQLATGSGLRVELRREGDEPPVPAPVREAVLMATRSLLANVVQHASASRCVVSFAVAGDELLLDVVDDGVGFDPSRVSGESFGLRALRERMAALGGTMELDAQPGEGTTVALRLPLGQEERR